MGDSYVEGSDLLMQRINRQLRRPKWMTEEMLREARHQADKIQRRVEDIEEEMAEEACRKMAKEFSITEDQANQLLDEGW